MKKLFLLMFLAFSFSLSCKENTPTTPPDDEDPPTDSLTIEGYDLVWNDEFNGTIIDTNKWSHEVNGEGGGNNELQYYTERGANSYIENGLLTIMARKEHYTGSDGVTREYTSARMRTVNKGDWKYGRFEIRAKLPYGQGMWPAIWMLPTNWEYGGWAASGEIDIMELLGHEPEKVYATLHYGGEYPNNVHTGSSYSIAAGIPTFAGEFHTFVLEWEENEMRWFVDSTKYATQTQWYSNNGAYPAPFNKEFHLLLNVAVGGNWPGYPDATTIFPQTMVVDFVRVYKKK